MYKNNRQIQVAIVGGGLAGLAAATELAEKGIQVTIFEAALQLGGRARSINVEFNSQIVKVDNGQHIMLGAYRETLKLLEKIGVPEKTAFMRLPLLLNMISPKGISVFKFVAPTYLPFPINLLVGFLFCYGLSFIERLQVIKLMFILRKNDYKIDRDVPLSYYLKKQKQSLKVVELLWEPLCLAALNTPLHLASTKVFLNVLNDTFNQNKTNSEFLLAKLDLSRIFAEPIVRYLSKKNVKILLNQRVRSVRPTEHGYSVLTKTGQHEFSHVIVATSPARLKKLLVELPDLETVGEQTDHYEFQPIYTVYLQYSSETTLAKPLAALTDSLSQWVFDRGILCGQKGLMAVVISAVGKHQKLTQETLAFRVAQELHHAFPNLVKPLWHKVIAEKRATFTCRYNLTRPANVTPYTNLFIAGDYTYADYPSTIEGAVRSGIQCAKYIINS